MKKIFSVLLILTISFLIIGSTFQNVDASAGGLNKSVELENLYYNNVLDETGISEGDILYGSGYNQDFSEVELDNVNIYNVESLDLYDGYIAETGVLVPNPSFSTDLTYIRVEPSSTYTFTNFDSESIGRIAEYDSDLIFLYTTNAFDTEYTLIVGSNTTYIRVYLNEISSDFTTLQMEEGAISTTYTAYEYMDSLYTNYFARDYNDVLQDAITWNIQSVLTNTHSFRYDFSALLDYKFPSSGTVITANLSINGEDYIPSSLNIESTTDTEKLFSLQSGGLRIRVNKTTYPTTTEFESLLNSGDVDFIYQLETSVDRNYEYTYLNYITIEELPYLYNLSDLFGIGSEPTAEEFEVMLALAPDYFQTYVVNYYEEDANISDFACERTATNIIVNGDFSTDTWVGYLLHDSQVTIQDGYIKYTADNINYIDTIYDDVYLENHKYYINFDVLNNTLTTSFTYIRFQNAGVGVNYFIASGFTGNNSHTYTTTLEDVSSVSNDLHAFVLNSELNNNYISLDNLMLFDLSILYGKGNEPTYEEFELLIADAPDYFDSYTYNDTCYMEVEQNNPLYQYADYIDFGYDTTINLTFTETILEMDAIKPTVYLAKYDLDMNYIGDFYEGNVDSSIVNAEGYVEHTFDYMLPSPTASEDGYIYIAYDSSDPSAKILGSGYVFPEVTSDYTTNMGDLFNVVSLGNYPYSEATEDYDFIDTFTDYVYNSSNPYILTHIRVQNSFITNSDIYYFSENTTQVMYLDVYDIYSVFSDMFLLQGAPVDAYELVFYTSIDGTLPPLLNYLNSYSNIYINYLNEALSYYSDNMINILYDDGYASNEGIFTYGLYIGSGTSNIAVGQTPLYYMDNLYSMEIVSAEVREGRDVLIDIYKDNSLLDSVYTYEYLYDNNTGIYDFAILGGVDQRVLLETFAGINPENATIYYYLQNVSGVYNNTAPEDAYDIYFTDTYSIVFAVPLDEQIDNAMEVVNMNSPSGRVLISSLLVVILTIVTFLKTKNFIITIFIDVLLIALLTLLGFIPLWIILVLAMLLFGLLFIVGKNNGGAE